MGKRVGARMCVRPHCCARGELTRAPPYYGPLFREKERERGREVVWSEGTDVRCVMEVECINLPAPGVLRLFFGLACVY